MTNTNVKKLPYKMLDRRQFISYMGIGCKAILLNPLMDSNLLASDRTPDSFWASLYQSVMHPLHADVDKAVAIMLDFQKEIAKRDQLELSIGIAFLRRPWCWMNGHLGPFESLSLEHRQKIIEKLKNAPGDLFFLYQGLKELCQLAHYSQDQAFESIGYSGPFVDHETDMPEFYQHYLDLKAQEPL